MKGDIGKDMLVKLGLAIIAAGLLIIIVAPLIQSAGAESQGCGAFRVWITDLSKGAAELC